MAGITLLEANKLRGGDVYRDAIVELFAKNSDVLLNIPFKTIAGNAYHYTQENTLPTVGFRGINASWTAGAGVVAPLTEHLAIGGGELDVDSHLIRSQGMQVRATHEMMKVKHLSALWTYKFIKGDNATTSAEFDGLQARLTASHNLLAAGSTANGDALSLAKLDNLIDMVLDPTHLIMSKAMRRRLTAAARTSTVGGHIDFTKDEFGRQIMLYADLPVLLADRLSDYYATLAFDEACPGGGTSTGTSIYCVSFRDGGCMGIQNSLPNVKDLGEISGSPVYRTRVEWDCGVVIEHKYAAARLYGVSDAAVTA